MIVSDGLFYGKEQSNFKAFLICPPVLSKLSCFLQQKLNYSLHFFRSLAVLQIIKINWWILSPMFLQHGDKICLVWLLLHIMGKNSTYSQTLAGGI